MINGTYTKIYVLRAKYKEIEQCFQKSFCFCLTCCFEITKWYGHTHWMLLINRIWIGVIIMLKKIMMVCLCAAAYMGGVCASDFEDQQENITETASNDENQARYELNIINRIMDGEKISEEEVNNYPVAYKVLKLSNRNQAGDQIETRTLGDEGNYRRYKWTPESKEFHNRILSKETYDYQKKLAENEMETARVNKSKGRSRFSLNLRPLTATEKFRLEKAGQIQQQNTDSSRPNTPTSASLLETNAVFNSNKKRSRLPVHFPQKRALPNRVNVGSQTSETDDDVIDFNNPYNEQNQQDKNENNGNN